MNRQCLALDLKDDPALIAKYEEYHRNVWPEILNSLRDAGITNMEIYRISNRLFMIIETTDDFSFEKKEDTVFSRALIGTYASHIKNMVTGVTEGFEKKLIVEGVGFRSEVKGANLEMQLGFSHPVIMAIPEGITTTAEKNLITVTGIDKEKTMQFAAQIRAKKKPEPYKGKGIRYEGEIIRRKQGKRAV